MMEAHASGFRLERGTRAMAPIATVLAAALLFCVAAYALWLLQRMEQRMDSLLRMQELLVETNRQLSAVSGKMGEMDAHVRDLAPLLNNVNANVRGTSPLLGRVNRNLQGTTPALLRMQNSLASMQGSLSAMQGSLNSSNRRLDSVQRGLLGLRQPLQQMEESTRRIRRVLPR